jgi:LPS-assembly protein
MSKLLPNYLKWLTFSADRGLRARKYLLFQPIFILILLLAFPGAALRAAPGNEDLTSASSNFDNAPRVRMVLGDMDPPVVVEADSVNYRGESERLEFTGQVIITRGDEVMTGDMALWDEPTLTAEISGNVKLVTKDFTATAKRAAVNMDLMLAKIFDGRAFFPERHYYVSGSVLERRGPETIYVSNAAFTTCDGPKPAWSLTAENILVNLGGLAESTGVTFRTSYFPMLYLPYILIPVKNERQTGFLLPGVSSSTRDGFSVSLPFFWAIKEDYDLTILPIYRSERGMSFTLEARYNLEEGEGIWIATYLHDRKKNIYNYRSSDGDEVVSRNLYWLRAQNNWNVGGYDLNLDLDFVSDPLFLYAFRNDPDGFFYSSDLFNEYFGRTPNEELDPSRLSTFFVQKNGSDTYFRGTISYIDNLYNKNNIDTLQNAPSLYYSVVSRSFEALDQVELGKGPRFGLDIQYDYYTRRTNADSPIDETGHRFILSPSFFWYHDIFSTFSLRTNGFFDIAAYRLEGQRPTATGRAPHNDMSANFSGGFSAELSTTLSRVFIHDDRGSAILHQVTPFISLELTKSPDQDELPYFDTMDRTLNRRTLRYGFRSTFVGRSRESNPNEGYDGYKYSELVKIGIFHSYEFASNLKWAENSFGRYYTTGYFDKGVGPLEVEIEAYITPYFRTRLLSSMDGRTGSFTSHDISLDLHDLRGDTFSIIYDYEKPRIEYGPPAYNYVDQLRGDLHVVLAKGWYTDFSIRYDLKMGKSLETYLSLGYQEQCYGVRIIWADSNDERRISIGINLLGLGFFGNNSNTLSRAWLE